MVGEAGDLSASRDPPQAPSVSRLGLFLFELWPELATAAAGGVLRLLTASLFPPGGCSKNRRAPVFALAGAPCGCSPLLLCVGGVSLPGGATCRDNLKQAKTFRAIRLDLSRRAALSWPLGSTRIARRHTAMPHNARGRNGGIRKEPCSFSFSTVMGTVFALRKIATAGLKDVGPG